MADSYNTYNGVAVFDVRTMGIDGTEWVMVAIRCKDEAGRTDAIIASIPSHAVGLFAQLGQLMRDVTKTEISIKCLEIMRKDQSPIIAPAGLVVM